MVGRVEAFLVERIKIEGCIHLTLIDPEKVTPVQAARIAENSKESGTTAVMIGGSTSDSQSHLDEVVQAVSAVRIPTILFPNGVKGISRFADAIWFMSLLNSMDRRFVIGAQIEGAPVVKKLGLEPISMGYVIVGEGGAAARVGQAVPVPFDKPELAVDHALAGQYLGMHFVYLEGGSGAKVPVPPDMIRMVKQSLEIPLIIGGGIKTREQAFAAASSGADVIVTGNVVETGDSKSKVSEIIAGIKLSRSV